MNFYNKVFGATMMLASVAMAMPAHATDRALSANELTTMVSNMDIAFSSRFISGVTSYRLDGSARTELAIGVSDQGKWWLDGDQVCTQWQSLRNGDVSCVTIYQGDGDTYRTSNGFTIRAL